MEAKNGSDSRYIAIDDLAKQWEAVSNNDRRGSTVGKFKRVMPKPAPQSTPVLTQTPAHVTIPVSNHVASSPVVATQTATQPATQRATQPATQRATQTIAARSESSRCITVLLMIISAISASLITVFVTPPLSRIICGN